MAQYYIMITIDTAKVMKQYPRQSGTDIDNKNKAVGIPHNFGYMVASDGIASSGQGTGDIVINAKTGDTIRVAGTSESNNFGTSVIVYNMPRFGGNQVFGPFRSTHMAGNLPIPSNDEQVLPATFVKTTLYFITADVQDEGKENFMVQFSVYDTNDKFYGCFQWDPTIQATLS